MIQPVDAFDADTQIGFLFSSTVGFDPETRIRLTISKGHRRTGRPSRYTIWKPNGTFHREWLKSSVTPDNPKGETIVESESTIGHMTAYTDEEAIAKANKRLG